MNAPKRRLRDSITLATALAVGGAGVAGCGPSKVDLGFSLSDVVSANVTAYVPSHLTILPIHTQLEVRLADGRVIYLNQPVRIEDEEYVFPDDKVDWIDVFADSSDTTPQRYIRRILKGATKEATDLIWESYASSRL